MTKTLIEEVREKVSGLTKVRLAAKTTPIAPEKEAPMAKAASLLRTRGMPMAMAATSSSRMAVQARPNLESSSRCARITVDDQDCQGKQIEEEAIDVPQPDHSPCHFREPAAKFGADEHEGQIRALDGGDALGAIGQVDGFAEVAGKHTDHFAKAQRDDGKIVTA